MEKSREREPSTRSTAMDHMGCKHTLQARAGVWSVAQLCGRRYPDIAKKCYCPANCQCPTQRSQILGIFGNKPPFRNAELPEIVDPKLLRPLGVDAQFTRDTKSHRPSNTDEWIGTVRAVDGEGLTEPCSGTTRIDEDEGNHTSGR
ncbi:hypothetical protein RB195_017873 [Necator americanus]|uniref:Uncharacterized protein n=1 Tax=Necator americanus TaxID=51031 RepID=A0ABR1CAA0_NECAM